MVALFFFFFFFFYCHIYHHPHPHGKAFSFSAIRELLRWPLAEEKRSISWNLSSRVTVYLFGDLNRDRSRLQGRQWVPGPVQIAKKRMDRSVCVCVFAYFMKWPCITLIIAPPFSRWFFVHSYPLRGMRMVDCASWVCITPSMIVTTYRWMLVLMCGHKYFFAFYCHFLHRKLELVCQEPGRWDIKNEAWLYSAWTTPNASTKYSTNRLVFGKLEPRVSLNIWCGHWPGGEGGGGEGGGETNLEKWLIFFFFFFFFLLLCKPMQPVWSEIVWFHQWYRWYLWWTLLDHDSFVFTLLIFWWLAKLFFHAPALIFQNANWTRNMKKRTSCPKNEKLGCMCGLGVHVYLRAWFFAHPHRFAQLARTRNK